MYRDVEDFGQDLGFRAWGREALKLIACEERVKAAEEAVGSATWCISGFRTKKLAMVV